MSASVTFELILNFNHNLRVTLKTVFSDRSAHSRISLLHLMIRKIYVALGSFLYNCMKTLITLNFLYGSGKEIEDLYVEN